MAKDAPAPVFKKATNTGGVDIASMIATTLLSDSLYYDIQNPKKLI